MNQTRVKVTTNDEVLKRKVLCFAVCTRLFIIFLSFSSNIITPDHTGLDSNVFIFPQPKLNKTCIDQFIEVLLGGLTRWDAQYFLHISHYGYTYESNLAFYPLFPFLTRTFALVLDFILGSVINPLSTVLISAVTINLILFAKTATTLFELSRKILLDDKLAYISALFFCINPASIFFTAPYSESCFAFFSFSGMLFCLEHNKNLVSSFVFGLSACTRSNGLINFGFLAHKIFKSIFNFLSATKTVFSVAYFVYIQLFKLLFYTLLFILPFFMFQVYIYFRFCLEELDLPSFLKDYSESKGLVIPSFQLSPWCNYTIPFSYSYVQSQYWDVGFLKSYRLNQTTNFLLAFPMLFLVLSNCIYFMIENKIALISFGFNRLALLRYRSWNVRPEFLVFVVHALFLSVFCALSVHIHVTTRILASSCPVVYWFVALCFKTNSVTTIQNRLKTLNNPDILYSLVETKSNIDSMWKVCIITEKPTDFWSYFVKYYFCSYLIVGTVLFSNFYHWT